MDQHKGTLTISKAHARRFLLTHQHLLPPRRLKKKEGILEFIQKVGCIQFDPINVVGRNPDLVLQSRVAKYQGRWLEELLYRDRLLWDGWDKMMAIYGVTDWPNFSRRRAYMQRRYNDPSSPSLEAAPDILKALEKDGPLSSIDFTHSERVEWSWGTQASLAKSVLDILYASGKVGVHHKVGTRRIFDLIERLLTDEILSASDPNQTEENYQDWHVLRRVGGIGLAHAGPSEFWGGILGVRSAARRSEILDRLVGKGQLVSITIQEVARRPFYIRSQDMEVLGSVKSKGRARPRAAILGALDNLLWDRNLVRWVFDFDYTWEVYKPVAKRQYGYYVLPVLFGDHFIGRFDPSFDRKNGQLAINNWWWEEDVVVDDAVKVALVECFMEFMSYLGAKGLSLGEKVKGQMSLDWISSVKRE